ncbi:MAG: ABC transporter permease [Dehalococcoidia bacterium]|nr:ABC transporter permease [Dehalococcoidia bacterium]
MTELFAGWRFAIRRLRAGWRFMLVAALGVLVAATLLAVTPIYATSMSDLGLRFRLDGELSQPRDALTYVEVNPFLLGDARDHASAHAIDEITEARLGWLGDSVLTEDRTHRFDVTFPDHHAVAAPVTVTERTDDPLRQPWGGFVYYLGGWEEHVEVVEGRLPGAVGAADRPEVVLLDGFQRHAALGDTVRLQSVRFTDCPNIPPSDDPQQAMEEVRCRPTTRVSTSVEASVVGFVRPEDADDARWTIFNGTFEVADEPLHPRLEEVDEGDPTRGMVFQGIGQMLMLTTQDQFDDAFRALLPETGSSHRSGVYVETSRIGLGEVAYAVEDMEAWLDDVRGGLGHVAPARTEVLDTLRGFRNAQSFSAVPLLVVLLQVVGIVVYYVMMVMAMLLERQQSEIGVYRSRGATTTQLVGLSFVEGLAFALPALLIAPWLASAVVSLLGVTPTFEAITGGELLPATVSPEAYLLAVGGAALSLLAVLLPSFIVVRRGIVDVKREESRPAERNLVQRYFLDFGFVLLAGLLLWQLNQRGSVFDPDAVGGWSSDPLLLAAPLAITAAVSLMVLRFYPPLVRLAVRILLLFRSMAAAIGLRRAGRAPASYARVALLVIMAVAVGTFAASYGPTVDLSLTQRARYDAGVDLRASLYDPRDRAAAAKVEELRGHEAVAAVEGVIRGTLRAPTGREVPLLAIAPAMAQETLWWREDFAEQPLDALMRLLQSDVPPGGGYVLPEDAEALEVLVQTETPERLFVQARYRNANGAYTSRPLEFLPDGDGWMTGRAEIGFGARPVTFAGFIITDRTGQNLRIAGSLTLDALTVVRAGGERELLDDFEGPLRWTMHRATDAEETFEVTTDAAFEGTQALRWTWSPLITPRKRVLAPGDPAIPLSVLMNTRALGEFRVDGAGQGVAQFSQVQVPLNVRALVDYFPTLNPDHALVIVNLEHLQDAAGLVDLDIYDYPNEVWVDFQPGTPLGAQVALAEDLRAGRAQPQVDFGWVLQARTVGTAAADPTLQASGSGILGVAFVAVLGLCAVGFVVTMVVGARSRAREFAVLRAVGASRGEILRALLLEWGTVLIAGAVVGALVGRRVARIMLGFLNVTEDGDPVVPPFVLATDWGILGAGLGILVGVVLASLLLAWATSMRRSPTIELRVTQ